MKSGAIHRPTPVTATGYNEISGVRRRTIYGNNVFLLVGVTENLAQIQTRHIVVK